MGQIKPKLIPAKANAAVDDKPSGKMSKEQKLKVKLKEKDEQIRRLSAENADLKSECELLRGRLFLLIQQHSME